MKGRGKRCKCKKCRKQFSVRVGTIFEDSKLCLRKWFFAIYLITAHKKGISSHQLARVLKITQKTAWFVLSRVRHSFSPNREVFSKTVEVDETNIGGREKNKHRSKRTANTQGRSTMTKTPVLGIYEREGKVFAVPVKNTRSQTIIPLMREHVVEGSTIYTDEWVSYRALAKYFNHDLINHSAEEFVRGDIHTQNIEGFWAWALLKRGIVGFYHHVSDKHLEKYVNEFRFKNRTLSEGSRFDLLLANTAGRLDYQTLTNNVKEGKTSIEK